jgi:hypothetical protein
MASVGASGSKSEYVQDAARGDPQPPRDAQQGFAPARNEHGQFAPGSSSKAPEYAERPSDLRPSDVRSADKGSDVGNMLRHIEALESRLSQKEKQLSDAHQRVEKFSARTREGMQSALDSLMKKWMDACETKDEKCKEQFKHGMEKLVQNSAEENGVWQMMVAASALHEKQEHDLDKLRGENNELKQRIDGHYATPGARTEGSLGKRKAEAEPERGEDASALWEDFAKECGQF